MANVSNLYDNTVVSGGSGNDYIYSWGDNVKIYSGAGSDTIYTHASTSYSSNYVTIVGGTGNDSIDISKSWYNKIQYANGDGNDTIVGYGAVDTIQITSGTYTKSTVGNDVVISVGNGKMTLKNAKNKTINIIGESQADISVIGSPIASWMTGVYDNKATNTSKNKTFYGTAYSDTLTNYAGGVKIYGYDSNDSIYSSTSSYYTINNSYGYVTIDGGSGDDKIQSNNDPRVSINGGSGNDSIYSSYGNYVTIKGGTGNDTITKGNYTYNNVFQYANGDGNDIINGYTAYDTIQITSGTVNSTTTSGQDIIVNVGSGKMTLKNAKGKTLNLMDANKRRITIGGGSTTTGGDYGGNSNNFIINRQSNKKMSYGNGNDTISNYGSLVTISSGGSNDYIQN
ncbi:MAG: hypothetical protein IJ563_02585, partial [Selenomonadaceae bacterium]|nr:hypothetical protein [Selenomonadaceae bacterium]